MNLETLIATRYSSRDYLPNPVEDAKLNVILEAAQLAPTAANKQPFQVIVIQTQGREKELRRIYRPSWFGRAPIVLAVVALPGKAWVRSDDVNYAAVDAAIVMDHMILTAASLGLGSCWVAAFDPAAAREVLGLPDEVEPIAFTPIGYPADSAPPKKRKPIEKLVRFERW